MPLRGVRYRTVESSKGPVRLAFRGKTVVEATNLDSGATHTPAEFTRDRATSNRKADQSQKPMRSGFLASHGVAPANRPRSR